MNRGCITEAELRAALRAQHDNGRRLGTNLLILGYLEEEELADFLSEQLGIPAVNRIPRVSPETLRRVPSQLAQHLLAFPLEVRGDTLRVAMADPSDKAALRQLQAASGLRVAPVVAPELVVAHAVRRQYDVAPEPETIDLDTDDMGLSVFPDHETYEVDLTA